MTVLLLRLAGPMQSWGTDSRFTHRDTRTEPSKSGVIGLVCAALGRPRTAPLDDLTSLRMAVRVDREGRVAQDFHTAQNVLRSNLGGVQDTVVSVRSYLADADFLVGLEGDRLLLEQIDAALRRPVWSLCLGRKGFPPGQPISLRRDEGPIQDAGLIEVMRRHPWRQRRGEKKPQQLRYVIEVPPEIGEPRPDVPVSFAERTFTIRHVLVGYEDLPPIIEEEALCS